MPTIATTKPRTIRMSKLDLDAETRLMRVLIREMKADGELPDAEVMRERGFSEPFIKKFLSLWDAQSV